MKTKRSFLFLLLGIISHSQTVSVINGNLKQPFGVAIDTNGWIVVADSGNNAIVKFSSLNQSVKIPGELNLNNPTAIALGNGYYYVADTANGVIKKINESGSAIPLGYGYMFSPRGVAVDNLNNLLYVTAGSSVIRMTTSGTNITTLVGNLSSPVGIATNYDGSAVYVATGDGTVKKLTNNGTTITTIASGLDSPAGVALDDDGNVFVADYFDHLVKKITPAGVVTTFASGLQGPWGIAVNGAGSVFVTELYTDHVRIFRPDGTTESIKRFHQPTGITTDAAGNIYITDTAQGNVKKMNGSGEAVTAISYHNFPYGIASRNATNSLVIANTFFNTIDMLNLATNTIVNSTNLGGILNKPYAVAADLNNVYIANTNNNNIVKYNGSTPASIYGNNGEFYMPMGITLDGTGHVFVADTGHQAIKKMTTSGNDITTIATGFTFPTGVLVDSSGKIYVADRGNNNDGKIVVLSSTGVVLSTITTGLSMPYSVTFDLNGDVLITDVGDNKIKKLNVASLAVTAFSNENEVTVYPNPTTDFIQISSDESIKTVALFDLSGKQIMDKDNPGNEISLIHYPKGMYMMNIIFESGKTETRRIVKE